MHQYTWLDAKKLCGLNERELKMAKELGMTPEGLIKNIPSPKERWKDSPALRIRRIYDKEILKL